MAPTLKLHVIEREGVLQGSCLVTKQAIEFPKVLAIYYNYDIIVCCIVVSFTDPVVQFIT